MGVGNHEEARQMAYRLTRSGATSYIEVVVETRDGANTFDQKIYRWTPSKGWHE